jgi:hypothetical protein
MGRGASKFDSTDVNRIGFDSDLPDLSFLEVKRAEEGLRELTEFIQETHREERMGVVRLDASQESLFKNKIVREMLTTRPPEKTADDFFRALTSISIVGGDSYEDFGVYFRLSADRVGVESKLSPYLSMLANNDDKWVMHLREGDGYPALCGADLSSPASAEWRPRGAFKTAFAVGNHCPSCLNACGRLSDDSLVKKAAHEERDYSVGEPEKVEEFYQAIRDNMQDILADEPENPDFFVTILTDEEEPRYRAISWMKRYLSSMLINLPPEERFNRVFKTDQENNGMIRGVFANHVSGLIKSIARNYGEHPANYVWPDEEDLSYAIEEAVTFRAPIYNATEARLVFLGALTARAWPNAAKEYVKQIDTSNPTGDEEARFFEALRLHLSE